MNGWACAVKICHDGMLEDTKSLDAAHTAYVKENEFATADSSRAVVSYWRKEVHSVLVSCLGLACPGKLWLG